MEGYRNYILENVDQRSFVDSCVQRLAVLTGKVFTMEMTNADLRGLSNEYNQNAYRLAD